MLTSSLPDVSSTIATRNDLYALNHAYLMYIERIEGRAKATVDNRRYILRDFVRYARGEHVQLISDIDIELIDNYLLERSRDIKSSSLGLVKQTIRSFLWYCQARQGIELKFDYSLVRREREIPPKIKTYTRDEIRAVIKQCDNHQDKLMIAVLFETGVRIGELVKISVEDIRGTEIRIRGKGSYDRVVFITPELSRALRTHTIQTQTYYGPMFRHQMKFSNLADDTYTPGRARERVQRQFEKAGISRMHPHEIRHSFSIDWLVNGGDLRTLQKILGHKSLEVTQRYLQTTDRFSRTIYEQIIPNSVL